MFVCVFVCVCRIGSKTTEPIELKFTHNLCGDPVKVIGNFFFWICVFVCLSVRFLSVRGTGKKTFFQISPKRLNRLSSNSYTRPKLVRGLFWAFVFSRPSNIFAIIDLFLFSQKRLTFITRKILNRLSWNSHTTCVLVREVSWATFFSRPSNIFAIIDLFLFSQKLLTFITRKILNRLSWNLHATSVLVRWMLWATFFRARQIFSRSSIFFFFRKIFQRL